MLEVVDRSLIKIRKKRDRHDDAINDLGDLLRAMELSTETSLPREKWLCHRKIAKNQGTTAWRSYLKRGMELVMLRRENRHSIMCLMGATCTTEEPEY